MYKRQIRVRWGGADTLAGVIDIKWLRDHPDAVRASQVARGEDAGLVDAILDADKRRRESLAEFEQRRAEQKATSRDVGAAMGQFQAAKKAGEPALSLIHI